MNCASSGKMTNMENNMFRIRMIIWNSLNSHLHFGYDSFKRHKQKDWDTHHQRSLIVESHKKKNKHIQLSFDLFKNESDVFWQFSQMFCKLRIMQNFNISLVFNNWKGVLPSPKPNLWERKTRLLHIARVSRRKKPLWVSVEQLNLYMISREMLLKAKFSRLLDKGSTLCTF